MIDWDEANAESLPYDGESSTRVLSCIGVMFAPHPPARAAGELPRVTRPGRADRAADRSTAPTGSSRGQLVATTALRALAATTGRPQRRHGRRRGPCGAAPAR